MRRWAQMSGRLLVAARRARRGYKVVVALLGVAAAVVAVGPVMKQTVIGLYGAVSEPRWDFELVATELSAASVQRGETVAVKVVVKNTGKEHYATCYIVVKITPAYHWHSPVHDTDRDLPPEEKLEFEIVDIVKDQTGELEYEWSVPDKLPLGVYYLSVEVWNPHKLRGGPHPVCFAKSANPDEREYGLNFRAVAPDL